MLLPCRAAVVVPDPHLRGRDHPPPPGGGAVAVAEAEPWQAGPARAGLPAHADGYWHPEDEALLPWFARQAPNTTSEKLQHATTGRYTFFGDLNPYPGFQQPATGC
jgi:hypothetical protein